jgi:hypothetical protein
VGSPLTNLTNPNTIITDGSTVDATEWTNNWATIVNFINASLVASFNVFMNKGDIMCYDGTNIQALSAVGVTNGWVLTAQSGQPFGLQWAAPAGLPLTTNGDTLYYNSGNQRLPIGTSGQVLTVISGLPAWGTPPGSLPTGSVIMWTGTYATIPSGWALMDGVHNASGINMQGLFPLCAGNQSPAANGGMGLVSPGGPFGDPSAGPGLGPSHSHLLQTFSGEYQTATFATGVPQSPTSTATVTPRYYALYFIEKQ